MGRRYYFAKQVKSKVLNENDDGYDYAENGQFEPIKPGLSIDGSGCLTRANHESFPERNTDKFTRNTSFS